MLRRYAVLIGDILDAKERWDFIHENGLPAVDLYNPFSRPTSPDPEVFELVEVDDQTSMFVPKPGIPIRRIGITRAPPTLNSSRQQTGESSTWFAAFVQHESRYYVFRREDSTNRPYRPPRAGPIARIKNEDVPWDSLDSRLTSNESRATTWSKPIIRIEQIIAAVDALRTTGLSIGRDENPDPEVFYVAGKQNYDFDLLPKTHVDLIYLGVEETTDVPRLFFAAVLEDQVRYYGLQYIDILQAEEEGYAIPLLSSIPKERVPLVILAALVNGPDAILSEESARRKADREQEAWAREHPGVPHFQTFYTGQPRRD